MSIPHQNTQNTNHKRAMPQGGFSHLLIPVGVVVVLAVAGIAVAVLHANHKKSTDRSVNLTSAQSSKSKTSSSTQPQSTASTTASSASKPSTSGSTKSSGSSSSSSSSAKSAAAPASGGSSAASTTPAQTPLSALTALITNLEKGVSTQVTASNITIPGPISNAQGRPIVFTVNGQTYFAYTQEQRPNFTTTPAQTANTMAIVAATQSPSLVSAYLDKGAILVNANQQAVGYSTGGD